METTEWIQLNSDHLNQYAYDEETRVLRIQFNSAVEYEYDDVPKEVAHGLRTAASPSYYFRQYIKGRYRFYKA